MMSFEVWVPWFKGLLAAGISGGASAITASIVDPNSFNFDEGLHKLLTLAAVNAIVGVSLYLKTSPLPGLTK